MSAEALSRETSVFDEEFIGEKSEPLTPQMKARVAKAERRGRGRPRRGAGSTRVLISIDRDLLRDADEVAKRIKLSRSELIADGLRMRLAKAG